MAHDKSAVYLPETPEPVKTGVRVRSVGVQDNVVNVSCENDEMVVARVLCSLPLPSSCRSTHSGESTSRCRSAGLEMLSSVEYSPCFSLCFA